MKIKQTFIYITPFVFLSAWNVFGLKAFAEASQAKTLPTSVQSNATQVRSTLEPSGVSLPVLVGEGGPALPAPPSSSDLSVPAPSAPAPSAPVPESPSSSGAPPSLEAESPSGEAPAAAPAADGSKSIVEMAGESEQLSTLSTAIDAAGLTDTLANGGPYTLFAPTNDAFAALPPGVLEALLQPENKDKLVQILTYHVLPTQVASSDLSTGAVNTLEGSPANIAADAGAVKVNTANVVEADVSANNGIIHVVDKVLIPQSLQ